MMNVNDKNDYHKIIREMITVTPAGRNGVRFSNSNS